VVAEGENLQAARNAGLAPVELSTPPARTAPTDAGNPPPPLPTQPAAALTAAPAPQSDAAGQTSANGQAAANGTSASGGAPGQPSTDAASPRQPLPTRAARATTSAPAPTPVDPHSSSALVITRPLRSGQRVYARHTDLVVIGMVSPGAEVIADGNVHVYGPLRGKAMAGARGDTSARIFTTHLDAELLAVAGVYRVVEDKLDANLHGQAALVRLDGDTLRIEALKA
jgi:septum site-determining protein MinC